MMVNNSYSSCGTFDQGIVAVSGLELRISDMPNCIFKMVDNKKRDASFVFVFLISIEPAF